MKRVIFFALAVLISFFAATYKWGDSVHSMGMIKAEGGKARHPAFLESGWGGYTLISTATVLPPYSGDVRVALEGQPQLSYTLHASHPVIDLGIRRFPVFKDDIFYGLKPGDRIALWVVIKPPEVDPVCKMPYTEGFTKHTHNGKDYHFCSDACLKTFKDNPGQYGDNMYAQGKYNLMFYDTHTGKPVLSMPVVFAAKGEGHNAGHH
ncbi:MAG: YHS domain-containing protein [Magnetococcales bacterium]|nr:YHS domain-containing protein [Nitrospirota bacterium]